MRVPKLVCEVSDGSRFAWFVSAMSRVQEDLSHLRRPVEFYLELNSGVVMVGKPLSREEVRQLLGNEKTCWLGTVSPKGEEANKLDRK
jgi:hypothetical protein